MSCPFRASASFLIAPRALPWANLFGPFRPQKQAEEYVNELPKEVVDQLGWANLVSDFQKEFLLGMLPSQELAEQLHNQALNAEEPAEE